jgi:uncharacterized membrane protein required for colicin V production
MTGFETIPAQQSTGIEWIDWTAISVLSVFFILGLFRGFVWQASRILALVAGFVVAGMYGQSGAVMVHRWFGAGPTVDEVTIYLSYVVIFLAIVVLLSLGAYFLQKLVKKSGLGFYDRVCGGFLGVATGACVMIFMLSIVYMFLDNFSIADAARRSKSMAVSQKTLRALGDVVPRPMQQVFGVEEPESKDKPDAPNGDAPKGGTDQEQGQQPRKL